MKRIITVILLLIGGAGFAQIKISALPIATGDTGFIPIVQAGVTKRISKDSLVKGLTTKINYTLTKNATRDSIVLSNGVVRYAVKDSLGITATPTLQQVTNIDSTTTRKVTVGKLRITDLPEFDNNESALAAGLQNGDQYRLPYNDGGYRVATVNIESPITIGLTVGSGGTVEFSIATGKFAQIVDWGDGSVQLNINTFGHIYTNAGLYVVTITYDRYLDITDINLLTNTVLTSYSQPYLPSLISLNISNQILPTAQVNAILIQLNKYGYAGNLNLESQTPPAPPTGNGIIAKNAIIARGGSVYTD